MADRSIAELNEATQLFDDGMTVVYQGNETQKIAGIALKNYARIGAGLCGRSGGNSYN